MTNPDRRYTHEVLPGVLGEQGEKVIYLREQGKKMPQKTIFGDREHKKTNFRFGGTCPFISGEQGNRYPLGGPQTCQHQVLLQSKI